MKTHESQFFNENLLKIIDITKRLIINDTVRVNEVKYILFVFYLPLSSLWFSGKESTCQCRRCKRRGFNPWVKEISWWRPWQPTPVFLPGKSHGQGSLVGYSPQLQSRTRLKQLTRMHILSLQHDFFLLDHWFSALPAHQDVYKNFPKISLPRLHP